MSDLIQEELYRLKNSLTIKGTDLQKIRESLQIIRQSTDRDIWIELRDHIMDRTRPAIVGNLSVEIYDNWYDIVRRLMINTSRLGFYDITDTFEILRSFLYVKIEYMNDKKWRADNEEYYRLKKQYEKERKFRSACLHVHVMSYKG